jgi:hypothetical protein
MPRFFMHLRDGVDECLDPEGRDFDDLESLRQAALFTARDLIAADIRRGVVDLRFRIDAETEAGQIVYTLPFRNAFSIIPEDGDQPTSP